MESSIEDSRSNPVLGDVPGTLHIDPDATPSKLTVLSYSQAELDEAEPQEPRGLRGRKDRWPVTWVNIDGLGTESVLRGLAEEFDIHPLALEDCVHTPQRPKLEEYRNGMLVITQLPSIDSAGKLVIEQVSLYLTDGFVLSFQEDDVDSFVPVRDRIRRSRGRIRRLRPDYLLYALLDFVVDSVFPVVEHFALSLEAIENEILEGTAHDVLARLHVIKRDLARLRRWTAPMSDLLAHALRDEDFLSEETRVYLRDCSDHQQRALDRIDSSREACSDLMNLYLAAVSHQTNQTMQMLTVLGAIFLPLTFIAGLYGMNFDPAVSSWNMPELRWAYGYPAVLVAMVVVAIGMILGFRRRGWIRAPE